MRYFLLFLFVFLGACSTIPPEPLTADLMTVSGRHGLPTASGTGLSEALWIQDAELQVGVAEQMGTDGILAQESFSEGVSKSLRNHGYLAADASAARYGLTANAMGFQISPTDGGRRVLAEVQFETLNELSETDEFSACLTSSGVAEFEALSPHRTGDGRRAYAIVAGVAFAFVGVDASNLITAELTTAARNNVAINAGRVTAYGQGVAPAGTSEAMTRYAGQRALQLAIADYVAKLHDCGASQAVEMAPEESEEVG